MRRHAAQFGFQLLGGIEEQDNAFNHANKLMNDILSGKFTNKKPVQNQKSGEVYALLQYDFNGEEKLYLTSTVSDTLISTIANEVLTKYGGSPSIDEIYKTIEEFTEKIYNLSVDERVAEVASEEFFKNVDRIINALVDPENIQIIINEVKDKLSFIRTLEETQEEIAEITDDEDSEDLDIELDEGEHGIVRKTANEIGGFRSASKRLRNLISFTTATRNIFGIPNTEWEKIMDVVDEDLQLRFSVDAHNIYNTLLKLLSHTTRRNMIGMMNTLTLYYRNSDPGLVAFINKVFKDILDELGLDSSDPRNILDVEFKVLYRSNTFNIIASDLRKHRMQLLDVVINFTTNEAKVYNANNRDVALVQRDEWARNWDEILRSESKEQIIERFRKFEYSFLAGDSKEVRDKIIERYIKPKRLDEHVDEVLEGFAAIGINLDRAYVRYSILKAANYEDGLKLHFPDLYKEVTTAYPDVPGIYDAYEERKSKHNRQGFIINNMIEGIKMAMEKGQYNLFSQRVESGEGQFTVDRSLGILNAIIPIAYASAIFNPTIIPGVVQNQDGHNLYDMVFPNHVSSLLEELSDVENLERLAEFINAKGKNKERVLDSILRDIENEEIFLDVFSSTEQAKRWFLMNQYNPLFVNANGKFNESFFDSGFDGFQFFIMSGMRGEETTQEGKLKRFGDVFETGGVSYKSANYIDRLVMSMLLFSTKKNKLGMRNKPNTSLFRTMIPGDSNLVPAFELPIDSYFNDYTKAVKRIKQFVKAEADRILRVRDEIKAVYEGKKKTGLVEGYHYTLIDNKKLFYHPEHGYFTLAIDGKIEEYPLEDTIENFEKHAPNGIKYYEFKDYEGATEAAYSVDLKLISDKSINSFIEDDVIQALMDKLYDYEIIKRDKDGFIVSDILPMEFRSDDGSVVHRMRIANWAINDYINSVSMSMMLFGDEAISSKNPIDRTKRVKSAVNSGPDTGYGTDKVIIVEDPDYTLIFKTGDSRKVTPTDGTTKSTLFWYLANIITSEGNRVSEVEKIYEKIEKGYPITVKESRILAANNAEHQPMKPIGFDTEQMLKTSISPILRSEVSYIKDPSLRDEIDALYDEIFKERKKLNPSINRLQELYKQLHEYYAPMPGRELLHNMLNDMELNEHALLVFKSASKRMKENVSQIINDEIVTYYDENNQRVVVPSVISKSALRILQKTSGWKNEIIDGVQKQGLVWAEQNPETILTINGQQMTADLAADRYRDYLKLRLRKKFDELKRTILSSDGKEAYYPLIMKNFHDTAKEAGIPPHILQYFDYNKYTMRPEHNINNPAILKKVEILFIAYLNNNALRPKVPGHKFTLAPSYGSPVYRVNGRIMPATEVRNKLSDGELSEDEIHVDRLRLRHDGTYEVMVSKRFLYEHGLNIGDYIPKDILKFHGVRIPTQEKGSMGKFEIVGFVEASHGNIIVVPDELIVLSDAEFDIDALYAKVKSFYVKRTKSGKKQIFRYGYYLQSKNPIRAAYYEYQEYLKSRKDIKKLAKIIEDTDDGKVLSKVQELRVKAIESRSKEEKKEIEKEISRLKESYFNRAINMFGYVDNYDDFVNEYGSIIETNVGLYNSGQVNEHKQSNIVNNNQKFIPITEHELNNILLDYEMELTYNAGTEEAFLTPASRDRFDEVDPRPAEEVIKIKSANTPANKLLIDKAIQDGDGLIGVSAIANTLHQLLVKYNVRVNKNFFGKDTFTTKTESGERVNSLFSLFCKIFKDNLKYLYTYKFNFSKEIFYFIVILIELGNDFNKAIKLASIDLLQDVNNALKNNKSFFDSYNKKLLFFNESIKIILNKKLNNLSREERKQSLNISKKKIEIDEILQMIFSFNKIKQIGAELYIFELFIQLNILRKELYNLSRIMQLIKGLNGKNFIEIESIFDNLQNLNIEYIKNANEKWIPKIKDKSKIGKYVLNLHDVINLLNDPLISEQINKYMDVYFNISGKFFIHQSSPFKSISHNLAKLIRRNTRHDLSNDEKLAIQEFVLSELTVEAIKILDPELYERNFTEHVTEGQRYSGLQQKIINASTRHPDNEFLKYLRIEHVDYNDRRFKGSMFYGYTVHLVKVLNRRLKDEARIAKISDGLLDLYYSENAEDKQLAIDIVAYLKVMDVFNFKSGSVIAFLSPNIMSIVGRPLDYIQRRIANGELASLFDDKNNLSKVSNEIYRKFMKSANTVKYKRRYFYNEYKYIMAVINSRPKDNITDNVMDLMPDLPTETIPIDKEETQNIFKVDRKYKKDNTSKKSSYDKKSSIFFRKKSGDLLTSIEDNLEEASHMVVNPFINGNDRPTLDYISKTPFLFVGKLNGISRYGFNNYVNVAFKGGIVKYAEIYTITNTYDYKDSRVRITHKLDGTITWSDNSELIRKNIFNLGLRKQFNEFKLDDGNRFFASKVEYKLKRLHGSTIVHSLGSPEEVFETFERKNFDENKYDEDKELYDKFKDLVKVKRISEKVRKKE